MEEEFKKKVSIKDVDSDDENTLFEMAQETYNNFLEIQKKITNILEIPGLGHFRRRIKNELEYYTKIIDHQVTVRKQRLQSSNLDYYQTLQQLVCENSIETILKRFIFQKKCTYYTEISDEDDLNSNEYKKETITVDATSNRGYNWYKIKTSTPEIIKCEYDGRGSYGSRSIIDVAKDWLSCASSNKINLIVPKVIFIFTKGLTDEIKDELLKLGVAIMIKKDNKYERFDPTISKDENISNIINLDVSSAMAIISYICNNDANLLDIYFTDPILQKQLESERKRPVMEEINSFLKGKEIIMCETAFKKFQHLVSMIGGVSEKERADELTKKIKIVADDPSAAAMSLLNGKYKIKYHNIAIFGTGDSHNSTTLTSNYSFIRCAESNGIFFRHYLHDARALTETKKIKL